MDERSKYWQSLITALNGRAERARDPEDKWRLTSAATRLSDELLGISGGYGSSRVLALLPHVADARWAHREMASVVGRVGLHAASRAHSEAATGLDDLLREEGWGCVVDAMDEVDINVRMGARTSNPSLVSSVASGLRKLRSRLSIF